MKAAAAEPIEGDEEEEDKEVDIEEDSSTKDLVSQQVPALQATMPIAPGFWASDLSDEVARRGLTTRSGFWGRYLMYKWC